jgi:hypothetical protein
MLSRTSKLVRELPGGRAEVPVSGSADAVGRHHPVTRRLTCLFIRIMRASARRVHEQAIGRLQ